MLRKLPRLVLVVILLTVILALPRFAHHTVDAKHYINVAKYFQGDLPREQLLAPFAYRVLAPFLAAHLPLSDLSASFALMNIAARIMAYLVFIPYLQRFATSRTDLNVGILMLVVSFPSFNYASGVLSDPVGFLLFVIGAYLLVSESYYLLSASICVGVLAREPVLCLVLASTIYVVIGNLSQRGRSRLKVWITLLITSVPPIAVYFAVRAYFSDVYDQGYMGLSLRSFLTNMTRPIGWGSFLLAVGPSVIVSLIGFRQRGLGFAKSLGDREARVLLSLAVASLPFMIYSLAVYNSGRYVWPFYTALIPIAVLSSNQTTLYIKWLGPLSDRILGGSDIGGK